MYSSYRNINLGTGKKIDLYIKMDFIMLTAVLPLTAEGVPIRSGFLA